MLFAFVATAWICVCFISDDGREDVMDCISLLSVGFAASFFDAARAAAREDVMPTLLDY